METQRLLWKIWFDRGDHIYYIIIYICKYNIGIDYVLKKLKLHKFN